jgi:ubiquinone/menaquinone biosynthesis C-methylase UbiE
MDPSHLFEVREQYELLPYPARSPIDERHRLVTTWLDDLPMLNQYCFRGRQDFGKGFRVLVAGGGTGDGTIYLAEQLKHTDASIVHLDLSESSTAIARQRAEVRSLTNITWIRDSLLNLPRLGLGEFDYINCSGVLHHLKDPDLGLNALLSCLKTDGAIGLIVYGKHARVGVYQMQELLRLMNRNSTDDVEAKIAIALSLVDSVPKTNWFRRGEELYWDVRNGPEGVYDLLLHSQDRAYTVGELYEWIADMNGLTIAFTDVMRGSAVYSPQLLLGNSKPALLEVFRDMTARQCHAAAELISGTLVTHSFYVTRDRETQAPYGDAEYIPFLFHDAIDGPQMAKIVEKAAGERITLNHAPSGIVAQVSPGRFGKYVFNNMDGKRTFREIFDAVRAIKKFHALGLSDAELFEDFREMFEFFRAIDRIFLRHASCR